MRRDTNCRRRPGGGEVCYGELSGMTKARSDATNNEKSSVSALAPVSQSAFRLYLPQKNLIDMSTPIKLKQSCKRLAEGDTQTPIRLFMQISRQNPQAILLESAEVDGRWGRYSVIATDYMCEFTCRDGKLSVVVNDPAVEELLRARRETALRLLARVEALLGEPV